MAEREILDLHRAWDDAEVRRDAAALDAILDDPFVFTYGGEAPLDKPTVMKIVTPCTAAAGGARCRCT